MRFFRVPWYVRMSLMRRTWRMERAENAVYLTFDDGPIPDVTPWVLDQLKDAGVKATFFCVGDNVEKHPEIYQRLLLEGHAVGNHTMKHEKGTQVSLERYLNSVEDTSRIMESKLFRPPYGRITWKQSRALRREYKIVMWSWLSYDFDPKVSVSKIIEKARNEIRSGDILVFHDNVKSFERLKVILPEVLNDLRNKGLTSLPIAQ
jgi:peptidoglycan/xylan/chitin deacetylase (PgdA/CDA1 family)